MTVSQQAKYQASGAGMLRAALINILMLTKDQIITRNVNAPARDEKPVENENSAFPLIDFVAVASAAVTALLSCLQQAGEINTL